MLFSFVLTGLIPVAHASTPTLTNWGSSNGGISAMWSRIGSVLYTKVPAADLVTALTGGLVNLVFSVIAGASALLIMYAGIRMIASRGKEDEFTQGKTIITYALIGLILSLIANAVITFLASGFLPQFLN